MDHRPTGPHSWTAARTAGGAALVSLAAAFAFLAIAGVFGGLPALRALDARESDWFREHASHQVIQLFAVLTNLGAGLWLIVLGIAVGVWLWSRRHHRLAVVWVAALAGNAVLNRVLKETFERARPAPLPHWLAKTSYAFPSAHSSGALVTYGALAYLAFKLLPARWHAPCALTAIVLILVVGLSRMILQAHYLTDVTAGFASGTAWLAAVIALAALSEMRRTSR